MKTKIENQSIFESLMCFNDIVYYDKPHLYFKHGVKMTSATTLLNRYEEPFDADYWANKKAMQQGVTPESIKAMWKHKNLVSTVKGTAIHSYIENFMAHKVFPYPKSTVTEAFNGDDPIEDKYLKILPLIHKFYNDINGKLIPIKSEVVVGDDDFKICGMIDQLFFNKKSNMFEIWDWKTNSELTTTSKYYLLPPISKVANSKLDVYSMQLSIYKLIFEKNTHIHIGNCYLNWFNENNSSYKIFKCYDYRDNAKLIINDFNKKQVIN